MIKNFLFGILLISSICLAQDEITMGKYKALVLTIENNNNYENPFNFEEIELSAELISPSGKTRKILGYFAGDGNGGQEGNKWKIRFMPDEIGLWKYQLNWSDSTLGGSGQFRCIKSGSNGMLTPASNRWKFSDADFDIPIILPSRKWIKGTEPNTELNEFYYWIKDSVGANILGTTITYFNHTQSTLPYIKEYPGEIFNISMWDRLNKHFDKLRDLGIGIYILIYSDDEESPNLYGITEYSKKELNLLKYLVARFSAYPTVIWDTGIDIGETRSNEWIDWFTEWILETDPWNHPVSSRTGGGSQGKVPDKATHISDGEAYLPNINDNIQKWKSSSIPILYTDRWRENHERPTPGYWDKERIRDAIWQVGLIGGTGIYFGPNENAGYFSENYKSEFLAGKPIRIATNYIRNKILDFGNLEPKSEINLGDSENLVVGNDDEVIVYSTSLNAVILDLSEYREKIIEVNWLDTNTGKIITVDTLTNISEREQFNPPGSSNWLLHLKINKKEEKKINLLEPANNSVWFSGAIQNIRWITFGQIEKLTLYYKDNNNWNPIDQIDLSNNNGEYTWKIPFALNDSTRIKIEAERDPSIFDVSSNIRIKKSKIEINKPQEGNTWVNTNKNKIEWGSNIEIDSVKIFYKNNNGWIAVDNLNSIPNTWEYDWSVPKNLNDSTRIKIESAVEPLIYGESPIVNIEKPEIIFNQPSSGDKWQTNSNRYIKWETNLQIDSVKMYYKNGNWRPINEGKLIENSGLYEWHVPDIKPDTTRIRIVHSNDSSIYGESEKFEIFKPYLQIIEPNSDSKIFSGTKERIRWNSNIENGQLDLFYKKDEEWIKIIDSINVNESNYIDWTVPTEIDSSQIGILINEDKLNELIVSTRFSILDNINISKLDYSFLSNGVLLKWQTNNEKNNKGFRICRNSNIDDNLVIIDDYNLNDNLIGCIESETLKKYSVIDTLVDENINYTYYLTSENLFGGISNHDTLILEPIFSNVNKIENFEFKLNQNYPNPFNLNTKISFQIPRNSRVKLEIYDSIGNLIHTLIDKRLSPGEYNLPLNGSNMSSGVYFIYLETEKIIQTKKMILLK